MKIGVMANAAQSIEADTAEIIATELGHKVLRVNDDDILKELHQLLKLYQVKKSS